MTTPDSRWDRVVRRGMLLGVVPFLFLALVAPSSRAHPGAAAAGATGGPVILGGDDLHDHGRFNATTNQNEDGWLYLQRALENVLPSVTRAGSDGSIAAIGAADTTSTSADAGGAIKHAALLASKPGGGVGIPVTFHEGAPAIAAFFAALRAGTTHPSIIWIAGTGATNSLSSAESTALAAEATSIGDFVNTGGGLISHGVEYGWLGGLLPGVTIAGTGSSGDLVLTPEGISAFPGITNTNINAGPWHGHFEGDIGDLEVLVSSTQVDDSTGGDARVIIGGAAVTLPGSIALDPATATRFVGETHVVTATVRDGTGALLAGATVTFLVTSGPNAGETGTATMLTM